MARVIRWNITIITALLSVSALSVWLGLSRWNTNGSVFLIISAYVIYSAFLNYSRYRAGSGWDLLPHFDTLKDMYIPHLPHPPQPPLEHPPHPSFCFVLLLTEKSVLDQRLYESRHFNGQGRVFPWWIFRCLKELHRFFARWGAWWIVVFVVWKIAWGLLACRIDPWILKVLRTRLTLIDSIIVVQDSIAATLNGGNSSETCLTCLRTEIVQISMNG